MCLVVFKALDYTLVVILAPINCLLYWNVNCVTTVLEYSQQFSFWLTSRKDKLCSILLHKRSQG